MSVITNNLLLGDEGYFLTKSLRFRSSVSAYLNRTQTTPTTATKWTYSYWVKRGTIGGSSVQTMISGTGGAGSGILFYNDKLWASSYSGGYQWNFLSAAVYRDTSAWYHIMIAYDSTQATDTNKVKIYVNGVQLTEFTTDVGATTYPSLNSVGFVGGVSGSVRIGLRDDGYYYLDGYLAEMYFVDGQQLSPSSFGQTSPTTGVWQPIRYTGTYGNNGFYLPFTDVATTSGSNAGLGKDFSGNGNYWTTNNISVTSGSTYDSMKDVPTLTDADTANYCTLNPLASRSVGTMQNGNLTWKKSDAAGDNYCCASSISIPSSGKWYWEVTVTDGASGANCIGIIPSTSTTQQTANTIPGDFGITTNAFGYYSDGNKLNAGSSVAYGNSFTSGDKIAVAVDTTNGKIWWSWNGTWQASGDPSAGTNAAFTTLSGSYYAASSVRYNGNQHDYNFGQRPFAYTPPTGFVALNTYNLPTPTIGATASTQANDYFDVNLYTGNSTTNNIVNSGGFKPDLVWIKSKSNAQNNNLFDVNRGAGYALFSNLTNAEANNTANFTSFNSNGFSLASNGGDTNFSGYTYVAWQWKANGTGVTNTAGSITSTVSANTTAGFSIVTYNTGSAGNQTVGHGLGVTPAMIIIKSRVSGASHWDVWHKSFANPAQGYMYLNLTNAVANDARNWANTAPTSTVFSYESGYEFAANANYVAYCFAQVAGYSAFGSYTGNGSTDGTFVYLGFRPKFIMIKSTSAGTEWVMVDSTRSTYNLVDTSLYANRDYSESTIGTVNDIDFLSNGFKLRNNTGYVNSSETYIYMAFAESPFKFALAR